MVEKVGKTLTFLNWTEGSLVICLHPVTRVTGVPSTLHLLFTTVKEVIPSSVSDSLSIL